jgi:N6-adenosine-specific RNA methylase IME4
LLPFYEAQAKERQGERTDLIQESTLHKKLCNVSREDREATAQAAAVTGANRTYVADIKRLAERDIEAPAKILAGGSKVGNEMMRELEREEREKSRQDNAQELVKHNQEFPLDKQYSVVYADPPWQYNDTRVGLSDVAASAAEEHYPTMSVKELSDLPVKDLAAKDCVLFCWATFPLLPDCLEVVRAWGFTYKTAFVWLKVRPNFGHYHNCNAELLLVCTKGSATPFIDERESQVQTIERVERHSAKPEEFRAMIDRLYPVGPRIELFRRGDAPEGWEVWGNETNK